MVPSHCTWPLTLHDFFFAFFTYRAAFCQSSHWWSPWLRCSKLSVLKYAEENSGEAAARCFSVDPKRGRDWRKNKTELQRLSEEDSSRTRLPAGGRKKAREELQINMREWVISKRARHERVSRKMIRATEKQMYSTVSDSRDEFAASAGWLNRFLRRNSFTRRRQLLLRRMPEKKKLKKFVTFSSRIFVRRELNACLK